MIDTSDVDRFAATLNQPIEIVEEGWQGEWSNKVADEWRINVAVDSGEYRDSIHVTDDGAASDAEHSIFNEYGTSYMAAQPALVPAIHRLSRPSAEDAGRRIIRQLT